MLLSHATLHGVNTVKSLSAEALNDVSADTVQLQKWKREQWSQPHLAASVEREEGRQAVRLAGWPPVRRQQCRATKGAEMATHLSYSTLFSLLFKRLTGGGPPGCRAARTAAQPPNERGRGRLCARPSLWLRPPVAVVAGIRCCFLRRVPKKCVRRRRRRRHRRRRNFLCP